MIGGRITRHRELRDARGQMVGPLAGEEFLYCVESGHGPLINRHGTPAIYLTEKEARAAAADMGIHIPSGRPDG